MSAKTTFRRWEIHRPATEPSSNLPFGVKSAGHYQASSGFQGNIFATNFVQVLWCAAGEGIIVINGRKRFLRAGQVALYFPKMEHRYYTNKNWDIYWCAIDGAMAPNITAAFGLNANIYEAGPPPVFLFRHLAGALRNPAPYGETHAVSLAFQLLAQAALARSKIKQRVDGDITGIVDQINANWNRPTFNVKNLADTMGVNRTSLSLRFHKALGISPGKYIANLRIQNAMSMLTGTKKTVTDIAASCGYMDRRYFARLLKKRLGSSPMRLRKNYSAGR